MSNDSTASLAQHMPEHLGNVLLVEDNITIREIATEFICNLGYHAIPTADAQEALLKFETYEGQIDVLLTDLLMPGMNGTRLAQILTLKQPALKVIFTSGCFPETAAENPDALFLQKPFGRKELERTLAEAMRSRISYGVPNTPSADAIHHPR